MMKIKRTNPMQKAKIVFVFPLAAVAVAAFASQRVENISEKVEQESEALVSAGDNHVVEAVDRIVGDAPAVNGDKTLAETASAETAQQRDSIKGKATHCVPETFPQFPGGQGDLFEYLAKNVKFPKSEHNKDVNDRVVVSFTVAKDGSITDAKIVKTTLV